MLIAMTGAAILWSSTTRAEIIERVLAVVQGVVITQSDATAAASLGLATIEPTDDPLGAMLAKLIDRQLILAEVERYAPSEPAAEAIDQRLRLVRARFASADAYAAALNRSGLDEPRLRQLLRDELRIEAYLEQRFPTDRRADLVADWLNGLRRRAEVIYLYVPRR
jgi:parvulin-like peptidyl-prolyl isomerase